jgi:phosphatidylglycerol:prolipoprotein diacylglycerol transferase
VIPLDLGLDPVAFSLGPLEVRWYGLLMALSVLAGVILLNAGAKRKGIDGDALLSTALWVVLGGVVGARLMYVATTWGMFRDNLWEVIRIDHGGLSFHGALLGGLLTGLIVLRRDLRLFLAGSDLVVPGVCLGYALVRIGNIFNGEVLGRTATALPFPRHPAQLYGVAIGLALLVLHARSSRLPHTEGSLFWRFVINYSILRAVVEETFRENPLIWPVLQSEAHGIGFFTLTQLVTPLALLVGYAGLRITQRVMSSRAPTSS